jgi:hypothetical protein
MGCHTLTLSRERRLFPLRFAGAVALALAVLIGWLSLRPEPRPEPEGWREFIPWCGSNRNPLFVKGEVRERFLWLMSRVFARWNVEHIIRDGRIFTRGEGYYEGGPISVMDIEDNAQWKVVTDIAGGVTIDDVFFPPPAALIAAIAATTDRFGPFPRRNAEGKPIGGPDERFEDCELMRVAILKSP